MEETSQDVTDRTPAGGVARSRNSSGSPLADYLRGFSRWHVTVFSTAVILALAFVCVATINAGKDKYAARQGVQSQYIQTCGPLAQRVNCVTDLEKALPDPEK